MKLVVPAIPVGKQNFPENFQQRLH